MLQRSLEMLAEERGDSLPTDLSRADMERRFRALCNVRAPKPVSEEFLTLQDAYLQGQTQKRGVIPMKDLNFDGGIALWQGDITRLACDAIVNAGNAALLGCFHPLHNCIDNVIHSNAGVQLRRDCDRAMAGGELPNGQVLHTEAYNLPSRFVFHTVGPIVRNGRPTEQDIRQLQDCYRNSLDLAAELGLETLAFCCISTGVYGYPQADAAALAVSTVRAWLDVHTGPRVIFDVFLQDDQRLYEHALSR